MTPLGKRIVAGGLIAVGGAFVWALLIFTYGLLQSHNPGETIFHAVAYAAYAVILTSWFVLPMGGMLGVIMPTVIRGCSRRSAFVRGALLGVCAAVIAAIFTIVVIDQWPYFSGRATIVDRAAWERNVRAGFIRALMTMVPVCAIWVGVWAYRWSSKVWPNPRAAANPAA